MWDATPGNSWAPGPQETFRQMWYRLDLILPDDWGQVPRKHWDAIESCPWGQESTATVLLSNKQGWHMNRVLDQMPHVWSWPCHSLLSVGQEPPREPPASCHCNWCMQAGERGQPPLAYQWEEDSIPTMPRATSKSSELGAPGLRLTLLSGDSSALGLSVQQTGAPN